MSVPASPWTVIVGTCVVTIEPSVGEVKVGGAGATVSTVKSTGVEWALL